MSDSIQWGKFVTGPNTRVHRSFYDDYIVFDDDSGFYFPKMEDNDKKIQLPSTANDDSTLLLRRRGDDHVKPFQNCGFFPASSLFDNKE